MYTYLQQALPIALTFCTQAVKRKWEEEGEPRESNEDFDQDWPRRFLACGVQVKIRTENSRYWTFSLLRLCFVFYGDVYVKNG